jgi:choline dehydrogenase
MQTDADFIVVGGGTAGCVMAAKLAARRDQRVLLVEAGGAPTSPFVSIPAGFAKIFGTSSDWAYSTTPQLGVGRAIFTPRGRMLGGCSALNAQIHQWGHPADFDGWRDAGASGWGWDDVAPVFRRQERLARASHGRGADGPLPVEPLAAPQPQSRAFVDAVRTLHVDQQASYNGAAYEGAWISEVNHRSGRRVSAYDAWLKPVLRQTNLRVMKATMAQSLVLDGKQVKGVRVRGPSGDMTLNAARGVVLCAGTFGSPQILMCSGIGPAAHLATHGIAPVHNAPNVGGNLHDHPMACLTFEARSGRSLKSAESPANLWRYMTRRTGMLASNVAEAIAFLRTSRATVDAPDLELLFAPVEWRGEGREPPRVHGFTIAVIALSPRSRGSVTLASRDMLTPPRIDPALLSDAAGADRMVMAEGVDLARRIARTRPLARDAGAEIAPGSACQSADSRQAWLNDATQTVYHPVGTCRMGSDTASVVDPQLAVRGVKGLWVADASVMPALPRGHPNAVVAMIAERGADLIAAT